MSTSINTTTRTTIRNIVSTLDTLDTLDTIANYLKISDVSNLRKTSKDVDKTFKKTDLTSKLEASSIQQNKARHELYNDKEFKKFVLEQIKIEGNIYGPENQKKIIVKLLKNINETDHNEQEKTKFKDWLSTYLKGCESVD